MSDDNKKKWLKKANKFRKKHAITLTGTTKPTKASSSGDEEEVLGNGKSDAVVCGKKCYAPFRTFKRALSKFPEKCSKVLAEVVSSGGFKSQVPSRPNLGQSC